MGVAQRIFAVVSPHEGAGRFGAVVILGSISTVYAGGIPPTHLAFPRSLTALEKQSWACPGDRIVQKMSSGLEKAHSQNTNQNLDRL